MPQVEECLLLRTPRYCCAHTSEHCGHERELAELKRAVAALGAIGRNLNQIARAANRGGNWHGPSATDLRALLRALEGLRDHVKALVAANIESWETGHDQATPR